MTMHPMTKFEVVLIFGATCRHCHNFCDFESFQNRPELALFIAELLRRRKTPCGYPTQFTNEFRSSGSCWECSLSHWGFISASILSSSSSTSDLDFSVLGVVSGFRCCDFATEASQRTRVTHQSTTTIPASRLLATSTGLETEHVDSQTTV